MDPSIETYYLKSGDPVLLKKEAIQYLNEYYVKSNKTKEYYEIVARGTFEPAYILNYYPSGKLLTVCLKPGNGWTAQYNQVSDIQLKQLSVSKTSLDDLASVVAKDSIMKVNPNIVMVKTNGKP